MTVWRLGATPIIRNVNSGGERPVPSLSYHQNTFDLLDYRLTVSSKLVKQIERYEQKTGQPVPLSVRQWYSLAESISILRQSSNEDRPTSLTHVLGDFARATNPRTPASQRYVRIMDENQGCCRWFIHPDGSEDPPVVLGDYQRIHGENTRAVVCEPHTSTFSEFTFVWVRERFDSTWRDPVWGNSWRNYINGCWLRSPREEVLSLPASDFLYENLIGREPTCDDNGLLTYHFYSATQRLRLTTDRPDVIDGHSAWCLHADTESLLLELAELVAPWLNMRQSLTSETEQGKKVLQKLRH